jgi:hypothetical protein
MEGTLPGWLQNWVSQGGWVTQINKEKKNFGFLHLCKVKHAITLLVALTYGMEHSKRP